MTENLNYQESSDQVVGQLISQGMMKIWYEEDGTLKGQIYDPIKISTNTESVVLTREMFVNPEGQFTGTVFRFPEVLTLKEEIVVACNNFARELLEKLTNLAV